MPESKLTSLSASAMFQRVMKAREQNKINYDQVLYKPSATVKPSISGNWVDGDEDLSPLENLFPNRVSENNGMYDLYIFILF